MQPTNPTFSDLYTHRRHTEASQYYSHFPTQNPNPHLLHQHHHHSQIEPQFSSASINPNPPGTDSYFSSYAINHAGSVYNAPHHDSGLTYPHTIEAAPPPPTYAADLLVQNWPTEESVQQYGNTLYATGGILAQDVSLSQQQLPSISTHSTLTYQTSQPHSSPWKKLPKKTKIAQSAWCEICKIECNTKDILYKHKLGKKHIKNVEKLYAPASIATTSAAITRMNPPMATLTHPIIGPVENPTISGLRKKKAETPQDLEIKRRKVLEGGAAANAVRTCRICNVVCNSDTVFRFHLAGQKHASMLKKAQGIV